MDDVNPLSIEVGDALLGERLDRAVSVVADVSRSVAGRTIELGLVLVNGEVKRSKSLRLALGDLDRKSVV